MQRDKMIEEFTAADGTKSFRCVWRNPLVPGKLQRTKRMSGTGAERYMDSLAAAIRYLNREISADDARITSGVLVHKGVHAEAPGSEKPLTLGHWLKEWLKARVDTSKETGDVYGAAIAHLAPWYGISVLEWKPALTKDVQRALLADGLAPSYINAIVIRIGGALAAARAAGVNAPVQPRGAVKPLRVAKRGRILTPDQIKLLMARITHQPTIDAVTIALATSMRQGEILALTMGAVTPPVMVNGVWGKPEITVRENAVKASRVIGRTKAANSDRTFQIDMGTYALLLRLAKGKGPNELLFASPRNAAKPLCATTIWRPFMAAVDGMVANGELPKPIRFHDLRHTAGAYQQRAGVPVPAIAERQGHSVAQFNKAYAHTDEETAAKMADVMAGVLGGTSADELAGRRKPA
jgi:integrase